MPFMLLVLPLNGRSALTSAAEEAANAQPGTGFLAFAYRNPLIPEVAM
jgi:hypothetical protein